MISTLLALAPATYEWSPKVGLIMIVCNIIAITIGKLTIQQPSVGPATPAPALFGGFGLPAVLATTSLGHIMGAGTIIGLATLGLL
jgi:photosystem I subunit 10